MAKKGSIGRKKGGRNKGYWYRKNCGWYITQDAIQIPLVDEQGNHLKDADTSADTLQKAYAHYLVNRTKKTVAQNETSVLSCVQAYLKHSQNEDRQGTFETRGSYLFDFTFGLTAKFWDYGGTKKPIKPSKADKIHTGYGDRAVNSLIPMDIQNWVNGHKKWGDGTKRIAIASVKRCFNYCVEMGLITANPIKGMNAPPSGKRITYIDDKLQEPAMYKYASKALGLAIKVCIKTGARYGAEFAKLTAKHVQETPQGMLWRFSISENKTGKKTGKDRVIFVPPDIAEIVREKIKLHPTGPIFRDAKGNPWKPDNIKAAFRRLKQQLFDNDKIKLDDDACMYSCRHTFAKRMLGGFWTGQPVTLEILAGLMGNTPDVCYEHYGKWCESFQEPLWDGLNGKKV